MSGAGPTQAANSTPQGQRSGYGRKRGDHTSDRMEPMVRLSSVVAPLVRDNVDTDSIIPAAFMRSLATDPATGLFAHWRYQADGSENPGFVLNDPRFRAARILLSGANFGCGSSRENAVWALHRFGFRCIIALGFSDIFRENCFKNGLLPVVLRKADHERLVGRATANDPCVMTVDVETRTLGDADGDVFPFDLDPRRQAMLMSGVDEIASTLELESRIDAFRERHRALKPWLYRSEP